MLLISCLTVTQPDRLDELGRSIRCFSLQTYANREMVIVHDGSAGFHRKLLELIAGWPRDRFRLVRADARQRLGELRNLAVARARGELVCQWDDDDLNHPERLKMQYEHLVRESGDFCFFTDQLHWFRNTGEFFWDDWNIEPYPMNLIQGTLMGRRDMLTDYPALDRGEDTAVLQALSGQGARLVALSGFGYLYIYVYSGKNTWDLAHHGAISAWKRLRREALHARRNELTRYLKEYELPVTEARFPHDTGDMVIDLASPA